MPLRALDGPEIWRQIRTLPNLLTLVRLAAIPVFVWCYVEGLRGTALAIFVGAALTDGLDGLLARALELRTRLGGILDPVADKLLTFAGLVTLVVDGVLPGWLLGLVVVRDGCIALAVVALRATGREVPASPSRLGKYATFLLAGTLVLGLAQAAAPSDAAQALMVAAALLSAQCVAGTLVQYFVRWRRLMRVPPPAPQPA